jgi:hypothetical protein
MSTMSQFFGGGIKSVQRGVITFPGTDLTATATVSSVNTSKSFLSLLGTGSNGTFRIELTNSTTVTATRSGTNVATNASWELIEGN